MSGDYIDLKIIDGDIVFENGTEALVSDKESLVQDIKHHILESNVLIELIANRNAEERTQKINQLIEYLENDVRIIPGSVTVSQPLTGTLYIEMDTVLGSVELTVE
jgi:hypothetical protein